MFFFFFFRKMAVTVVTFNLSTLLDVKSLMLILNNEWKLGRWKVVCVLCLDMLTFIVEKVHSQLQVDVNSYVALIQGLSTSSRTLRWWNSSQEKRRGNIDRSREKFGILVAPTRNSRPHLQSESHYIFLHNFPYSCLEYKKKNMQKKLL